MHKDKLEIEFGLDWKLVVQAQKFLVDFFQLVLLSRNTEKKDLAGSLSVVLMELMENVMKYAAKPPGKVVIEVDGTGVSIRVENYATEDDIRLLNSQFEIISQGEPRAAYVQKMLSTATEGESSSSRLGLARIRVESLDNFRLAIVGDLVTASVNYPF